MMLRVKPLCSSLAVIALASILALGCAGEPPARAARDPQPTPKPTPTLKIHAPIEISIVGTNDLHGRLGSLPVLGGYLNALRAARPGRVVPDGGVAAIIAPAIERAAAKRAENLGVQVEAPIPEKYKEESALGNLISSLMLELDPGADIAINNAGNLRAG